MTLDRRLMAEWLGTFSLLATVVGSGIMAERLTRGTAFGPQGAGFGRLNIACTRARLAGALDRLVVAAKAAR